MKFTGRAWRFGDDVDTDAIIPARYLNTSEPRELALHCMEDADPTFPARVQAGDIIIAGKNFGCGSSREHAPISIKAAGVSCVIARSFARIFYRNAINIGLPIFECPEGTDGIENGDILEIDAEQGLIVNQSTGKTYRATPFPPFMQQIMAAGGLIDYVKERVRAGGQV